MQPDFDVRVLDVLQKSRKGTDVNNPAVSGLLVSFLWQLRNIGFLKKSQFVRFIYELHGGTLLHAAAYFDKPQIVCWLLENNVDAKRRSNNGNTALDLAVSRQHKRCSDILRGDTAASRRYSISHIPTEDAEEDTCVTQLK